MIINHSINHVFKLLVRFEMSFDYLNRPLKISNSNNDVTFQIVKGVKQAYFGMQ